MKSKNPNRIRFAEKAAYFGLNLGNIPIQLLITSYLSFFYTNVCGLPLKAVGTLLLLTKILDGLNDPVMGYIIDHIRPGRLGRFRTVLLIGTVVCTLNYALLWFGPLYAGSTLLKLIIAYISYILIGITFDLMDIPLNSLLPVMTSDLKERNVLSLIKGAGYMLGGMGLSIAAPLIIASSPNSASAGYVSLISIACAIVLVCSVLGVLGVKERVQPISEEKYTFRQLLVVLKQKPVLIAFLATLLYSISSGTMNGANTYFAVNILGNITILSAATGMSVIGMLPAMILAPLFANKISKGKIYGIGLAVVAISNLVRLIDVTNVAMLYVCYIGTGVGTGVLMTVMYAIQADNVDYVEAEKGIRAEGAIASLSSFITKAAGGIGGALPAYILAISGYNAAAAVQSQSAIGGVVAASVIVPSLLALAAAVLFLVAYPITNKTMQAIQATLNSRRAENSEG